MDVRSSIRNFLSNAVPQGIVFSDTDNLLTKGVVDSLRMLDMMSFLETQFHLKVDEDDLMPENFESIEAITRFVKNRIKA